MKSEILTQQNPFPSNHQEHLLQPIRFNEKKQLEFLSETLGKISFSYEKTFSELLSSLKLNSQDSKIFYRKNIVDKNQILKNFFKDNKSKYGYQGGKIVIQCKQMNPSYAQKPNDSCVKDKMWPGPRSKSLHRSCIVNSNNNCSQNSNLRSSMFQISHQGTKDLTTQGKNFTKDFVSQKQNESLKSPSASAPAPAPAPAPADQNLKSFSFIVEEMTNHCCTSTIGLRNFSLNCFVNSSLQILIHLKDFIYKFSMEYLSIEENLPGKFKEMKISPNFFKLCYYISRNEINNTYKYFSRLLFELKEIFPDIEQNKQNDTQRFLRCLLNVLHKELCMELDQSQSKFNEDPSLQSFKDYYFSICSEQKISLVSELFYTYVETKYFCGHTELNSYDQMLIVPLFCNEFVNVKKLSFQRLVDKNFSQKEQENIGICKRCRTTKMMTQFVILPKFLFFSIQRSIGNNKKINFDLLIEEELYLSSKTSNFFF